MKTKLLALFAVISIISSCEKDDDSQVDLSEIVEIPDTNFKTYLLINSEINTNGDNEITELEASTFTGGIFASNSSISDVTGLENFFNVTRIALYDNSITSINLSNNTKVTQLLLENNSITSIDVSALTALVDLKLNNNELEFANVANGNNANMTRMEMKSNADLTCIKVDELPIPTSGWDISFSNNATYNTACN